VSRKLRPEEIELWKQVAAKTERLEMGTRPASLDVEPQFVPAPKRRKLIVTPMNKPTAKPSKPSARATIIPAIAAQVHAAPDQMDRKSFDQMKRGKLKPEGRIDLHGMTLDRAHPALTRFILSAQGNGKRLVLVITGKGKLRDDDGPIPVRFGVLRHQVPQWMSMPPLSSAILQVTQAHLKHGGGGAYYVYLRKPR